MFVKPEIERFAKIRVVGIGGAGCNVLNTLIDSQQISGVEFIAVNTDAQDLSVSKAFVKVPIGQKLTGGLGSGADPAIGRKAAEESLEALKSNLADSDMVFITAGMGGGTGTGAAPIVAAVARELGALTVGVVTKPFYFEGGKRMENAELGISQLKNEVDALIIIPNQRLLEIADEELSILDAFKMSDSVLTQGVQGISDLIVLPGLINVDFADVKTIMANAGSALMGIGIGTGENRAVTAAKDAISSPLLDVSIEGATGILFNVIGGKNLTMQEVNQAAEVIRGSASPEANIIFGAAIDEALNDQVKITVIATGFDQESQLRSRLNLDAVTQRTHVPEQETPKKPDEPEKPDSEAETEKKPDNDIDEKYKKKGMYDIPAFLRGN